MNWLWWGKTFLEVESFYEDIQDLLELMPKKDVFFTTGDLNAKVGCQEIPGITVKWAIGSITANKAGGTYEITEELFKILKDDVIKVFHSICQQIWKTQLWPIPGKSQSSSQSPRRAVLRNFQTTVQLHSSPMLVRWCSKSSKLGFSRTWTKNFQMYKLDLEKSEEPEIANIHWITEKVREF